MGDHDNGYKLLFSHAEMVEGLLRGFVREDWVDQVDFTTLEKADGSYVSEELKSRHDDIVWRVRFRDRWLYVYLLIEFQSAVDPFMAVRLMAYIALLYQDLIRRGEVRAPGRLPPVLPVVLYNGAGRWNAARDVADLVEPVQGQLAAWRPRVPYLLIDEGAVPEAALTTRNLVAKLFQLERCQTPGQIREALAVLIEWLQAPEQRGIRRSFTIWFGRVLLPGRFQGQVIPEFQDLQEVRVMLEERVKEWTRQWKEEGRAEGRAEERGNTQREIACRLLARGMPVSEVVACTGLTTAEVEGLKSSPTSVCEPPPAPYRVPPSDSR